ncbi:oxoglutarate (alpha-ketoglutarate) receptor 1a, tandem duplicate 2, partial [Silurus asotus]
YLSPMYGLEFTFGFIGNLFVVLSYIFCLPTWRSTNVYLFNLSLSDLIFLCTLPELSYNYAHNKKEFNSALCVINRYILHVNLYSSILFMMWVSVDRYLLLCHPHRGHILLSLKAALCITALNWIWVNVQIVPLIVFIIKDLEQNNWKVCHDFASLGVPENNLIYTIILTISGFVLPLLALFLSSQRMVTVLIKRQEVLGTSFKRPVKIVRTATLMFLLFYTPIHVMRIVRITSRLPKLNVSQCVKDYINVGYIVTRPIAFAHSAINPVFYFLMTDSFKEALQDKQESPWTMMFADYIVICGESREQVERSLERWSVLTPIFEKYYLSPMYGLEFVIGFLGNLVVVLGYIFCLPAWKSTNVYLFNLSMSDLIFFCTLPELSYNYAFNLKKFNSSLCVINRYILNVNMYSSILFMMWVSVDRYLLLCHPQREHVLLTIKAALCITIVNWIWVTIQIAPLMVLIIQDLEQNGWTVCRDFGSLGVPKVNLIFTSVLTITGFVVPLVALFISSQRMVSVLMKREEMRKTKFQRPVRIVRIATLMFLVLYTPIHIMRIMRLASRLPELKLSLCIVDTINAIYIVSRPIAYFHSVINPVFYFLMTDSFKEALQD